MMRKSFRQFGRSFGVNADKLAFLAFIFKLYEALYQGEQRIVFAFADIVAGFPLCTALARNDVAAEDMLAAKFLEAKPLSVRIAAVSG